MLLVPDQIDAIVVKELQSAHDLNLDFNNDEGGYPIPPDWELLEAIETVLKYYMVDTEYQQWYTEVGLRKMTTIAEMNGEYGEPQTENDS